jgi:hypothetical protein
MLLARSKHLSEGASIIVCKRICVFHLQEPCVAPPGLALLYHLTQRFRAGLTHFAPAALDYFFHFICGHLR